MNFPRAAALMLTGLAAGLAGRLCFTKTSEESSRKLTAGVLPRAGTVSGAVQITGAAAVISGPRPEPGEVLAAAGASRLRLLMAWLPGASDEELLQMAGKLMKTVTDENLSIRLLMARWAEVNPQALLKWAESQPGSIMFGREFYIQNAIEAWARVDFDGAWAAAVSGQPKCRGAALLGLTAVDAEKCRRLIAADPSLMDLNDWTAMGKALARIAAQNPAGAAALLEGGPAARQLRMARGIAASWVKSDPAAAVEWMRSLSASVRAVAMESSGEWIAAHAPDQVPALLDGLPPGRIRSTIMAADFKRLATEDPAAARQRLDAMSAGPSRQYCRALLMKELFNAGDDAGAKALAGQIGWHVDDSWQPGFERTEYPRSSSNNSHGFGEPIQPAMQELFARIAARDPTEAADILSKSNGTRQSGGVDPELLATLTASDPAAVASALMARQDAANVCSVLISHWAAADPTAAAAWVDALPKDTSQHGKMVQTLISEWAQSDPAAMLKWTAQQQGVIENAWSHVVARHPEYATSHLDDLFAANRPDIVSSLLGRLNFKLEEARNVIRQMPDNMEVAIASTMNQWLQAEPQQASEWVQSLAPGIKRDNATEALACWLTNQEHDYEAAFKWAATLPPERRTGVLRQALNSWRKEDPVQAAAAVRASGLTPQEQRHYLDSLGLSP